MTVYSDAGEDRVLPAIVYGLYLLGLATLLPLIIGFFVALVNKGNAGPRARSHYIFQIRTVWTAIGWAVLGCLLVGVGFVLSFILVGIPILVVGALILGAGGVWLAVRCIAGLIYLLRDEAYPRPYSWLF